MERSLQEKLLNFIYHIYDDTDYDAETHVTELLNSGKIYGHIVENFEGRDYYISRDGTEIYEKILPVKRSSYFGEPLGF